MATEPTRLVESQRLYFQRGRTKSASFRRRMLRTLYEGICRNEKQLLSALQEDLGKSSFESYATEIGMVKEELRYTLKHLSGWMKSQGVSTPLSQFPSKSVIYNEPLGVVLIIAPWNYPVNLSLTPLISAIAAGNCAVLKLSRSAPASAAAVARLLTDCFPQEYIAVAENGEGINEELLAQPFDHIFFTGSSAGGRQVMAAAAKGLIPVTLELGGKSPCIVDKTASIDLAARRIVWGKCLNAGQTCVAPDYVLVEESVREKLLSAMERYLVAMFGSQPLTNDDLPKIINEKHFDRLISLMEGEQIRWGGEHDRQACKIAPAILEHVKLESPVMGEEIFGPLIPVLSYSRFEDALAFVREREKPLALYLFTTSRAREKRALESLSFGGGCINDTVVHLTNPRLPFGGIGASGMGAYHGKTGFDALTHQKSVLKKSNLIDLPLRYAPYEGKQWILRFFLR